MKGTNLFLIGAFVLILALIYFGNNPTASVFSQSGDYATYCTKGNDEINCRLTSESFYANAPSAFDGIGFHGLATHITTENKCKASFTISDGSCYQGNCYDGCALNGGCTLQTTKSESFNVEGLIVGDICTWLPINYNSGCCFNTYQARPPSLSGNLVFYSNSVQPTPSGIIATPTPTSNPITPSGNMFSDIWNVIKSFLCKFGLCF